MLSQTIPPSRPFEQCEGCLVHHKLVDNLNLFHELQARPACTHDWKRRPATLSGCHITARPDACVSPLLLWASARQGPVFPGSGAPQASDGVPGTPRVGGFDMLVSRAAFPLLDHSSPRREGRLFAILIRIALIICTSRVRRRAPTPCGIETLRSLYSIFVNCNNN